MKIIEKKISDIKPYENKPRINDGAVEATANSIKEFGWQQPVVIDEENVIIAGHTRYKAAQKLGLKKIPCVVAEGLTPEQVKAYRLADNKTGELATWDLSKLDEELAGLFDMSDFGFSEDDIPDIPEFIPEDENFLDNKREHVCPHCGFRFTE